MQQVPCMLVRPYRVVFSPMVTSNERDDGIKIIVWFVFGI